MKASKAFVWGCCLAGIFNVAALGAETAFMPAGASAVHWIDGNEIILEGGGQKVFLEIYVGNWDPDLDGSPKLRAWQAKIDSTGYSSALRGTLTPWNPACATDGDCEALMGSLGHPWGTAKGGCGAIGWPDGECIPAWIDNSRTDYVFAELGEQSAVDVSTLDYRYGSTLTSSPIADSGTPRYAGTLALDVPLGVMGTFTVGFQSEGTQMQDENGVFITPLTLTPALITVHCLTNSDCVDDNACTDDTCEQNGSCSHENNYDDEVDCCNPVDGTLTQINDGNSCTSDTCDPSTGEVSHVLLDNGTPCDDGLFCNLGETCMDGVCGGGTPRDCDDQIECTEDSCDEDGDACVNAPDDSFCPDDGLWCNGEEFCNPGMGCDRTDPPCGGPCDEELDICLCDAPSSLVSGGRFLAIAAEPADSDIPQAILITPDCPGGISRYVGPPSPITIDAYPDSTWNIATLVDDPSEAVYLTPPEWGNLLVYDQDIVPAALYQVQADCGSPGNPGLSDPTTITTPKLGDTVGRQYGWWWWNPPDGTVNIMDIIAVLDKFRGLPGTVPIWWVDLVGTGGGGIRWCTPNLRIDIIDVAVALDGFRGFPYTQSTGCPEPCP